VLVHGTTASHTRWAAIRPRFEARFTVTAIDRRGRGQSGDAPDYDIEREFEDTAAVVESLDPPVLLFGHSFGAICALEAALRTEKLTGLVLYEPPIIEKTIYAPGQLDRLATLLAAGDRAGMVTTFFTEVVGLPPHELEIIRTSPAWPDRVAAAHTILRECRAEETYRLPDRIDRLTLPVLLLLGSDSPVFFGEATTALEKALPNARTIVMPGQRHMAMDTGSDLVVGAVFDFWKEIGPREAR
jgi:pimeloyl-ACP methyl ester carboxylesterase